MTTPSPIARLTDLIESVELIRSEMVGVTLRALKSDRRKRWLVERGIEIISAASRHLSDELKARHPEIPWSKVAGSATCCAMSTSALRTMYCGGSYVTTYRPWRRPAARNWRKNRPSSGTVAKRDGLLEARRIRSVLDLTLTVTPPRPSRVEIGQTLTATDAFSNVIHRIITWRIPGVCRRRAHAGRPFGELSRLGLSSIVPP